jgi:hypothetical protein
MRFRCELVFHVSPSSSLSGGRSRIGSRCSSVRVLARLRSLENGCGMSYVAGFRPPQYLARPFFEVRLGLLGVPSFTPERRALERPIAIACRGERAPCFPSRTWHISSRTNSPACVDGDFPSRASSLARSIVLRSGIGLALLFERSNSPYQMRPHQAIGLSTYAAAKTLRGCHVRPQAEM